MPLNAIEKLENGTDLKIVCFGDSITGTYYHTGGRRAWTEALGQTLTELYPQARLTMINAGISGNTSGDGLARMDTDVLAHQPDLIVAMFGMNDAARSEPENLKKNLQEIIDRAHKHQAEIVLMTPNAITHDDPSRTAERVIEFVDVIRGVARENNLTLADTYTVFEDIRDNDPAEWTRIMSDSVHPNMRGHRLFAAIVGEAISGRKIAPPVLPDLHPRLPHLKAMLESGHPIRITAMKPADALIESAILAIYPNAQLIIEAWDPAGKSMSELEEMAKQRGWHHYSENPDLPKPDLTVIAVPSSAFETLDRKTYLSYGWIINWSQSFGSDPRSDCLPLLPSVWEESLSETDREAEQFALEGILDKDLPFIRRTHGDSTSPAELLSRELASQLGD